MIDLEKIEALSALKLKGEEKEKIIKDLEEIIEYFEILKEVDTEGLEPLIYTKGIALSLREDKVTESLDIKYIERNRKLFGNNLFRVKRIIGE